jgi:hypothetical protein
VTRSQKLNEAIAILKGIDSIEKQLRAILSRKDFSIIESQTVRFNSLKEITIGALRILLEKERMKQARKLEKVALVSARLKGARFENEPGANLAAGIIIKKGK